MTLNQQRAEMYARAEYYAWSARRSFAPMGNDPITGVKWPPLGLGYLGNLGQEISRAGDRAAAEACYRRARSFPNPLPR